MEHADGGAPLAPCIVQSSIGNDESNEPAVIEKQAVSSALEKEDASPPKTSKRVKKSRSITVSPGEQQGVTLQEENATPRQTSKRFKKSMSTTVSPGEQRGVTVVSPNPASKVKELSWKVRAEMVKCSRRYCMYIFV